MLGNCINLAVVMERIDAFMAKVGTVCTHEVASR